MGIILTWGYYLAMLLFIVSYIQKISLLLKNKDGLPAARSGITLPVAASAAVDILLFRRLFSRMPSFGWGNGFSTRVLCS